MLQILGARHRLPRNSSDLTVLTKLGNLRSVVANPYRPRLGTYILGAAAIATGIVNLVWGAFDPAEEPIQAWGSNAPSHGLFPDVVAVLLIAGGAAVVPRRSVVFGSIVLAFCYLLFTLFCAPRLVWGLLYKGWTGEVGAAVGVGQNLIILAAAALVYISAAARSSPRLKRPATIARWIFGLSTITFGLGHLTSIGPVAKMIPTWMPLSGSFWAILTGIAFVLAGIAMLCGILDVVAARLLALMLLIFSLAALLPLLFAYPHDHGAWGVNVYNLAAVGAALVLSEWLASTRIRVA